MRQRTFSGGFEKHSKQTRKEKFLSEMDQVIPWKTLTKELEQYNPNPQGAGRRPKGLERMLRIYFMQHWYNLSDPAMEEALYDSRAMLEFAGVDLGEERAPDESTILQFRHLMEAREFGAELLRVVNTHLAEQGLTVSRGTIGTPRSSTRRPRRRTRIRHGVPRCTRPSMVLRTEGPHWRG